MVRSLGNRRAAISALSDQAISSVTNFGLTFLAARTLGVEDFGLFTTAYLIYIIAVGAVQALVGQELVLLRKATPSRLVAIRSALGFLVIGSIIPGVVLVIVGMALPPWGLVFVAMGALFPPLMIQEGLRCAAALLRAPQLALVGDAAWLLLAIAGFALVLPANGSFETPAGIVVIWGVSGAVSVLVMYLPLRRSLRRARSVPRRYLARSFLGHRFLAEYLLVSGTQNLSVLSLGFFASTTAIGALRGSTTLYGPLRAVFNAVSSFGTPMIMDVRRNRRVLVMILLSTGFAAVAGLFTLLLLSLNVEAGRQVLGETWPNVVPLLLPTGVQFIAMAFSRLGYVALRLDAPKSTLVLRLIASIVFLALFFGGFVLGDVLGAAWGAAVAGALQSLLVWSYHTFRTRSDPKLHLD